MELIVMVLVPLPLGYFLRQRIVAFIAYIAVHAFTFTFQTAELVREWVGGSTEAFAKDPMQPAWAYLLVNALIYAAGFGLVALGHRLARRRRSRNQTPEAVDLAH